jgi:hypothetical protein
MLSELYEQELNRRNLSKQVTAYRFIPHPTKNRGMNNVDFAEEIFSFVRQQTFPKLFATTFDIKSFFDNLDHQKLKQAWMQLLNQEQLPPDHFNVFKGITQFSYVDFQELFNLMNNSLIARDSSGNIERIKVNDPKNIRSHGIIAFCTSTEFRHKVRPKGIVKANKRVKLEDSWVTRKKGIPQGSPISSILANIYLVDFDSKIAGFVKERGGIYRRYSDDIVVVSRCEHGNEIQDLVLSSIKDFGLEIQPSKTDNYQFSLTATGYVCAKKFPDGTISQGKRFSYLGFEFDGQYTYLKSASLAKYYRRMKRSVRRGAFYAKFSKYADGHGQIFRRRLYKRFSYLGGRRKMKWLYDTKMGKWHRSYKHDWGNYLTYANMAHFNMKNSKIRRQVRKHWTKLNDFIKSRENWARGI